jgi:uncharacterized protein YndB with AHSA1/START domain
VFAAFSDPKKKRQWFAGGHSQDVEEFTMDFRVGGIERMRSRMSDKTPFPGVILATEGTYLEIAPGRRIVQAGYMTLGERRISAAMVTIELLPTATGTDLICTHQGAFFEGSDGPKMREEGWRKLFDNLATELG